MLRVKEEIQLAAEGVGKYQEIRDKGLLLDFLLSNIRVLTIRRSKKLAYELRREETELYSKLNDLSQTLSDNPSAQQINEYENTRNAVDRIKQIRGKAAILRSLAVWTEEGERPSAYFFRTAKTKATQMAISSLRNDEGNIVRGNKNILDMCVAHYKTLYSSRRRCTPNFEQFKLSENARKLTEGEKLLCEGPVTLQECKSALDGMARNKTAGISGFTAEFFSHFWGDIGQLTVDYFNDARENGKLFISHRRGVLTLIPKKGSQLLLKNKRPICLLDIVYKLIAKVLANRLSKVIGKIVSSDQTGFVKNRFIGENLRLIADVIDYCKMDNLNGILLAIDYSSAFDCLEHDFLMFTLKNFNFGEDFQSWIRLLYKDAYLAIKNNGHTSSWFACTRGSFQGSPISGQLFILAAELLASKIRHDASIRGIKIRNVETKISQYCDDTTLFLGDTPSTEKVLECLMSFQGVSGLEINMQKSNIMWLGAWRNRRDAIGAIAAVDKVKILGVWHSATQNVQEDNITPIKSKIQNVINSWSQRKLSIKGRIVISKSLLASKLVYLAACYCIASADLREIHKNIMKFIWCGKPPKVAQQVLCQKTEDGGLKAVDTEKFYISLRLAWIRRIFTNHEATWRRLLQERVGVYELNDLIKNTRCDSWIKNLQIPVYYQEIFSDFQKMNKVSNDNVEHIRTQSLWYNDNIKIRNQPVFFKNMYDLGIKVLDDLVGINGRIMNVNQIQQKFPTLGIDFLRLNGLISAIPMDWRQLLRQYPNFRLSAENKNSCRIQINNDKFIRLEQCKSRVFYWKLIQPKIPIAQRKWAADGITPGSWKRVYEIPYSCTMSTQLQTLHYRIINRYIPTKKFLVTRGITGSPLCNHCDQIDDLKHHFYECPNIKRIWEKLLTKIKRAFRLKNEFVSCETVMLGSPSAPSVVNLIILIIKQRILSCKISSEGNFDLLHFECLTNIIKNQEKAEYLIAEKNNRLEKHKEKWRVIINNDFLSEFPGQSVSSPVAEG